MVARKYNTCISQFVCVFVQANPYKVDDDANDIRQDNIKPEAVSSIADTYNPPKFGLKLEKPKSLNAITVK